MAREACAHRALAWSQSWVLGLAAGLGVAATAIPAAAQTAVPAKVVSEVGIQPELTAEQRDQMYAALSREVDELERHRNILKTVAKLVSPTVVHIEATKRETATKGYSRTRIVEEAGSGVILFEKGAYYVLTNRHVIRDAELHDINVQLADRRILHPLKVWTDPDTDVAVLSIDGHNLVAARLGDSDPVEIGDFVLAVGSPFGLSHSVTYGIISAKGRSDLELEGGVKFQNFMQTDAAINPGNSGGPLVNLRGEVIGINTAIASNSGGNEGIGFSIPINVVMIVARQLIDHGSVQRGYLGVQLDAKFTATAATELGLPRHMGARIASIRPGSPAEQAKVQVGDIILQFNGAPVLDDNDLVVKVNLTQVGAEVPIVVYRDGVALPLKVTVGGGKP